ncbi:Hypothetical protein A7982_08062 [Minicystis rosea]|nr:Hypothetical protein A7982_08062 [Minicystis rosea]
MPVRIAIDVPAFSSLSPGQSARLTVTSPEGFDEGFRGEVPPLPPGRYRWNVPATAGQGPGGATLLARSTFDVEGLGEDETRALSDRVIAAQSYGCGNGLERGQRALVWTAGFEPSQAALKGAGTPEAREALWHAAARYPESTEFFRQRLEGALPEVTLAAAAVLRHAWFYPEEVRSFAQQRLLRVLTSGEPQGYAALRAVHESDWNGSVVQAVAARVRDLTDEGELQRWGHALRCPRVDGATPGLGELVAALRARAARTHDPALARALREHAGVYEARLRARLEALSQELRIARGARRPEVSGGIGVSGCGIGYAAAASSHQACAGLRFMPEDPLLRYLRSPLRARVRE